MKEIRFVQRTPQGLVNGTLRISGSILYFKCNNNQYSEQMLSQMRARKAEIVEGDGWIRIDLFKNQDSTTIKLGEFEFDLKENPKEEIENILTKFYVIQYTKAKFKVNWRDLKI